MVPFFLSITLDRLYSLRIVENGRVEFVIFLLAGADVIVKQRKQVVEDTPGGATAMIREGAHLFN
ncbi:hypothetical protein D9M68_481860 [compost metagenome]